MNRFSRFVTQTASCAAEATSTAAFISLCSRLPTRSAPHVVFLFMPPTYHPTLDKYRPTPQIPTPCPTAARDLKRSGAGFPAGILRHREEIPGPTSTVPRASTPHPIPIRVHWRPFAVPSPFRVFRGQEFPLLQIAPFTHPVSRPCRASEYFWVCHYPGLQPGLSHFALSGQPNGTPLHTQPWNECPSPASLHRPPPPIRVHWRSFAVPSRPQHQRCGQSQPGVQPQEMAH